MRAVNPVSMVVLYLVAALTIAACGDASPPPSDSGVRSCDDHDDCDLGWYCDKGICTRADQTCDDTHPCPDGYLCENNSCVFIGTDGGDGDGDGGDEGEQEPEPDIEIQVPPLTGDPPLYQLNFGNVMVGLTVGKEIKIANVGNADLQIMQLNFEACPGMDDFAVPPEQLESLPIVVAPGGYTFFDVNYTASDGLTDHCILDIVSNDPDEALVKVHLLSEFKGQALASLQPQALNFGDIPVGETSQPLTFTVSNQGTGNAVLTVREIRFGILGNPDFSMTIEDSGGFEVTPPVLLNSSDFVDVSVVYHPQAKEADSDEAIVMTDDPTHETLRVTLSGNGVVGILDIQPSPVDVGRVRVGTHGQSIVIITNTGGAPTALAEVYLWDAGPELSLTSNDLDLADLPNNPHQLGSSQAVEVMMGFDPIDIGREEASLIVENTSEDWYRVIAVSAEGYIPAGVETEPDPPVLIFGNVQIDFNSGNVERKQMQVIIRNVGEEPLQINNMQLATMTSLEFTYEPTSIPPIDVGVETVLDVFFRPADLGSETGGILVDTSDPDIQLDGVTGRFRIDMQANGIDPNIFISPAIGHNFGDVYVGMPVTRDVRIRNAGTGPLELQSIELTPGSSSTFTLENRPVLPIVISNPMTEIVFQVRYLPNSLGTDSGAIRIDNSDIGNPSIILNLLGNGTGCPTNTIDCDSDPSNGCETPCIPTGAERCNGRDDDCDCRTDEGFNLNTDVYNCGNCGNDCTDDFPNGVAGCTGGICMLLHCADGYANCDANDGNGCEINTDSDVNNCGTCTNQCSYDHAADSCLGGVCVMGNCDVDWKDCNSSDADGCEINTDSDIDNCGSCGLRCIYANATGRCQGGFCVMDQCLADYADCDVSDLNGCEVDTQTDVNHCGSCGNACPTGGGTVYVCIDGVCQISSCGEGLGDCDGNPVNGCETNIRDGDPNNCNGCGVVCDLPNATEDCVNYSCVVDACDAGWGDCDNQDPNGCETNTTNDVNNCDTCGSVCSFAHAGASCQGSQCVMGACDAGYYNVDGLSGNGCECAEDTVSNVCDDATITDLGILGNGDVRNITGNIVPNGDEDWYTFAAPDNNAADINTGGDNYRVHVVFTGGGEPEGIYFDIYRHQVTSTPCSGKGSPWCSQRFQGSDYFYHCDTTLTPDSCGDGSTETCTCKDNTSRYWIRVYRAGAHAVTCNSYTLNITFTQ